MDSELENVRDLIERVLAEFEHSASPTDISSLRELLAELRGAQTLEQVTSIEGQVKHIHQFLLSRKATGQAPALKHWKQPRNDD